MDAEHVQALLNRFYALIDPTVTAYGGSVIDHAGDGVLAVFGAPVAYGNDTERAVRAAIEMHAAAAQITDPSGEPLELHIGVASGEVVAAVMSGGATPKYAVTGDTVNLAARLDALAEPGDTLLSESAHRSVSNLVDAEDLGEKAVKGFEARVRVYRVRALQRGAVDRLPFVGRHSELRQLASVLDSVQETGTGVAVVVRGDPGIGKSRLVEELRWRAQPRGFACCVGRVLDFGVGKGQEALPAVVAAILGLPGLAAEPLRRSALERELESGLVAPEHEALVSDLLDLELRGSTQAIFDAMDNATRMRRTAEGVADLAEKAARQQPRLIVLEDIHWASPLLLSCLAELAMATRTCPLVLAMTTRFEGDPLNRHWRAASHGTPLLTIDVGPLRPEEARVLAGGVAEFSNRFATECIERAEGNPLFLEQLLRNAAESETGNIPPTIQSLVLARMDRLPTRDKLALQAASVIGKRFTPDGLRSLIEDAGYRCDALVTTDLVRPEGGDYLFAHALIQEGVYSSLLNSRKRELHRRAADWYGEQEPVLRAEHLDRAQDPGAAAALLAAAQEEARRLRCDTALRLAQRGWELARERELRYAFAMLRGELLREVARTPDSIEAFEQALQTAADDEQRCHAWLGIAAGHRVTGDMPHAMDGLAQAQPIAERLELWSACSRIHSTRGNLYFAQGKVAACGAEHQLALDCARRAGDLECEAVAWSGLGDHCYAEGRFTTGLRYFQRCVELCRQAGLMRVEIPSLCMTGHCLVWNGEGDAGLREIRGAVELSHSIGLVQIEVMALESLAFALVLRDDFAEAESWLGKATAVARQATARRYLAINHLLLAACRRSQGNLGEARKLVDEAFEISKETGMAFLGPSLVTAKASIAGDPAERRRWLREGEAMLEGDCLAHGRLMFYRDAIDLSLEDGSWEDALRYAEALEEFVRREPMRFAELVAARARGLVALARRGPEPEIVAGLKGVRDAIRRAAFGGLLPGVDAALASV
jgi:tetratricopeptide (TPR) repeat protein